MTQTNYTVPTAYGLEWNARSKAGEEVPPITTMVIGDGVRAPIGSETELVNEVHRKTISRQGVKSIPREGGGPDHVYAYFDAYMEAHIGGFVIREHGLLTSEGKLVAIGVRNPGLAKPDPATGASDDFTYRISVLYAHLDALVVQVDPIHGLTADNLNHEIEDTEFAHAVVAAVASQGAELARQANQQMKQELHLRKAGNRPTGNMENGL